MTSEQPQTKVIHFGALPPTKHLTLTHVHQILGFGNHSTDVISRTLYDLRLLKKDVREWAGNQIKSKMAEIARATGSTPQEIMSYSDLKEWWSDTTNQKNDEAKQSLYNCIYGFFEDNKGWEDELEELYMTKFHFQYNEESKKTMQEQCRRKGYQLKGCIARNISMVKQELVKQVQKAGRSDEDGVTLTKNKPKGTKNQDVNSKRRKKGEFYVKPLEEGHSPIKKRLEDKKKVKY
jgi:hypothetical protein